MRKRHTTESFIEKSQRVHGSKYDYTLVEFQNTKTKVRIVCPEHGEFQQTPGNHMFGQGCSRCGDKRVSAFRSGNTDNFVSRAKGMHNNFYDYSKAEYVCNSKNVTIICPLHGPFNQSPASHLVGSGCPVCSVEKIRNANTNTTEDFLARASEVHGDRYDYSKVVYKNFFTKVEIICKEHGSFWQTAGFHTSNGNGCPSCAQGGFSPEKKGILYVLESGDLTKVGITNFSGKDRAVYINNRSEHNFTVVKEYEFDNGWVCDRVETEILALLRKVYKSPVEKFHGYTECFYGVDREELLSILDEFYEKA